MPELTALELKAFVPAMDFELSKQFYADLGFTLVWSAPDGSLAYFQVGPAKFMLQNHFVREAAEQLMLHLLVPDVEVWNARIREQHLLERYPIRVGVPEDRAWGMRDLTLHDPSGVLWRIGHSLRA